MKILTLEQNTPEWHEFRRTHIGASDAPIIMGVSPFRTPLQLWQDKTQGTTQFQNSAMKRGIELEPKARAEFEKLFEELFFQKVTILPCVAQSDEREYAIASLDGYDLDARVCAEIKCPGEKDHQLAVDGKIPPKYMPQLQHQLYVTGLNKMYYFSYGENNAYPVILECTRDDEYIANMLLEEEKFYRCMLSKTPPALTERDYVERTEEDFCAISILYCRLKMEIAKLQEQEERTKEKLIELAGGQNCTVGALKISQITRQGSVDYSKIKELHGVDLNQYRKPASSYTSITIQ